MEKVRRCREHLQVDVPAVHLFDAPLETRIPERLDWHCSTLSRFNVALATCFNPPSAVPGVVFGHTVPEALWEQMTVHVDSDDIFLPTVGGRLCNVCALYASTLEARVLVDRDLALGEEPVPVDTLQPVSIYSRPVHTRSCFLKCEQEDVAVMCSFVVVAVDNVI